MQQGSGGISAREILIYVGLPFGGAVVGHLWTRYRRRLATLRWTVHGQPIAFATEDFGWGKVEILYNGQPAGNLHIINVQVVNDSQIDLTEVELDVQMSEGTNVLRSAAQVQGTVNLLPFAGGYATMLAAAGERALTAGELATWTRRSDFRVPVLNRGGIVDLRFLVTRADFATPTASVHCNHAGVRVRPERPAQQLWGVNQARASLVGLFVGLVAVEIIVRAGGGNWAGVGVAWLIGAVGAAIGVVVVKTWRWISRMAS
jgi:hypothetical protein